MARDWVSWTAICLLPHHWLILLIILHQAKPRIESQSTDIMVYSESIIKMTQAYLSCQIVDIKPPIRKTHLAFATQKNSPLYPALRHHINNLKEFGLVQKYIKSHRMEAQVCKDYSGEPVTIKQCYSAFKILSVGMLISFCCWIFEWRFKHQNIFPSHKSLYESQF